MKSKSKTLALKGRQMIARGNAPGTTSTPLHPSPATPGEPGEHIGPSTLSVECSALNVPPSTVFSFHVTVVSHPDWGQTVNARTAGEAKGEYLRDLHDAWPDIPYTALRCRKIGTPQSSERFIHNAEYRGLPQARCGDRVQVGSAHGTIVGHNESANFTVLFDENTKYRGARMPVHPSEMKVLSSNLCCPCGSHK